MKHRFYVWILKKIIRDVVSQGRQDEKIIAFHGHLITAARDEYTEDTKPTLDDFLKEMHDKALEIF